MRWIWIDHFVKFQRGKSARAVKNLSFAEDYFADHFPGFPIMPAALILEGLAQTGGILVGEVNDFQEKVILAKITRARFHREAHPGQQLLYDVELLQIRDEGATVEGKVSAREPEAAENEAVPVAEAEIFFAHLDKNRSAEIFGDHNFVFTGELKNLMGLAKVMNDPEG